MHVVLTRYILHCGTKIIATGAGEIRSEHWIGVEIESPVPIDVMQFSRSLGYDLIPAADLSQDMLASVGVDRFERITIDGSYVLDGNA